MHNHLRTHGSEARPGRAGMGLGRSASAQAGRLGPLPTSVPPFLAPEGFSTLKSWRRRHSQGESHSHQEAIHNLEREEGDLRRGIDHLEGSTQKWRRRKIPSEG
jgi:hypothetical protein